MYGVFEKDYNDNLKLINKFNNKELAEMYAAKLVFGIYVVKEID